MTLDPRPIRTPNIKIIIIATLTGCDKKPCNFPTNVAGEKPENKNAKARPIPTTSADINKTEISFLEADGFSVMIELPLRTQPDQIYFSASETPLSSTSKLPHKNAPSAISIRAVLTSQMTFPLGLIVIFDEASMFPRTSPATETSLTTSLPSTYPVCSIERSFHF